MNTTMWCESYVHGIKLVESGYGWYFYNAHGDVVQLADNAGVVTQRYDYPYLSNMNR